MTALQNRQQEALTPLIQVTETAQGELGKALMGDPDQPQNIRLVIQGFG